MAVAKHPDIAPTVAGKWRQRVVARGVHPRPHHPRTDGTEKTASLSSRASQEQPGNARAWSVRCTTRAECRSNSTVQHWFFLCWFKPHPGDFCKLSGDLWFVEHLRDGTGRYLNPPENAMGLFGGGNQPADTSERVIDQDHAPAPPCAWSGTAETMFEKLQRWPGHAGGAQDSGQARCTYSS